MISIQKGNESVLAVCGKQKIKEKTGFRKSSVVLTVELPEGELWHHTLTGEMVFIPNEEKNSADVKTDLTRRWFYVPEGFDECRFSEQVRTVAELMSKKQEHLTGFDVLTTTDCNARCFYCYEKGIKRVSMSEKTAHDTAAFIIRSCGGEKVKLQWFGGEPLFNSSVISIIVNDLIAAGVEYSSVMVSNGYLFDEETVKEAKELWKLKKVQITLDGREEVYNRTKAYIYKNVNAYQTVLDNIGRLLENGIQVNIRLNLGSRNTEELFALTEELAARFGGRTGFSVYSNLLYDFVGNGDGFSSPDAAMLADEKLKDRLKTLGISRNLCLDDNYQVTLCMAASDRCVLIAPDGHLGKCEHYIYDESIGTIYEGITDKELVAKWKERPEGTEKCRTCAAYPLCSRWIKNCPIKKVNNCSEKQKISTLNDITQRMLNTYGKWKTEQTVPTEE